MTRTFILALTAVVFGRAQQLAFREPTRPANLPTLSVDANLVLVPVTVTDQHGAIVGNLKRANFILIEEKERQEIISLSHETAPVSIGILVDLSGSMAYKIAKVRSAADALLDNVEPEDEGFLATFSEAPELRLPFSKDKEAIRRVRRNGLPPATAPHVQPLPHATWAAPSSAGIGSVEPMSCSQLILQALAT
jgi:hypothetical protein